MITVQPTGLETAQLTPARVGLGFNQKPVKPEHERGDLLPLERRTPHGRPTLPLHHRGRPPPLSRSRLRARGRRSARATASRRRTQAPPPPPAAGAREEGAAGGDCFSINVELFLKKLKTYENVGSTFLEKLKFNIFEKILVQLFSIFWKNVELNFFRKIVGQHFFENIQHFFK